MANKRIKGLTVEIGGDTTKLGKALDNIENKGRDISSELREIDKLLKLDPGNTDLLAQKQKVLGEAVENTGEKLEKLKEAEKQVQKQFERGEVSEEQYRALQREIVATEQELEKYEKQTKETAKGLDKMEKETEEVAEETDGFGGKLKDAAKGGLAALATGVTALLGGLVASAEATREYRTEMGKLDTAFTTNGHSSEAAKTTYQSLQGVLGETEQAVEAANHLAKLTDNEKDLATWTDIATGVYATFGASLPIEGLTEAANETAKVGQVTGPLADALNWAGVSEDKFNESLAKCSSEQERQTLIMETLNGLYDEAAEKYKEANAEVIRANQANEQWTASLAEIGGAIEPILTDVKLLGASLLSDFVPGVTSAAAAIRGILNGDEGAAGALGGALSGMVEQLLSKVTELVPTVAQVALSLITTLTESLFNQLPTIINTIFLVLQQVATTLTEALPTLLPAILQGILGVIEALMANIPVLLESLMLLINGIIEALPVLLETLGTRLVEILIEMIYNIFPQLITLITEQLPVILQQLIEIIIEYIPWLIESLASMVTEIATQLIPQIIKLITDTLPELITTLVDGLVSFIPALLDAAITLLNAIVEAIPVIIKALLKALPGIINTILKALMDALPVLLDAAIKLLFAIIDAIPVILDALADALPTIIDTIISAIIQALPMLLDAAITLLMAIIKAIPKIIPILVENIPRIINSIIGTLLKNLPLIINAAVKLFMGIIKAIPKIIVEIVKQIPSIIKAIVKGLGSGVKDIFNIGKDLIKGLWNGIKDMTSWITDKLKGFGDTILGGIKSFFGIKSPSRVMAKEVGRFLPEGLAKGVEDNADTALDAMTDLSKGMLSEAEQMNGLTIERRLHNTFDPAPEAESMASGLFTKLDKILQAIEKGQILTIDGESLIGATVDKLDNKLGQRRNLAARGAL